MAVNHFDIAIIGGGLAGLLHLERLIQPDLRIALIDPNPESLRQKTFAYWRKPSDLPHAFSTLVENRWHSFKITDTSGNPRRSPFGSYCYERIAGERLHEYMERRLQGDRRIRRIVSSVQTVAVGPPARITLDSGETLTAGRVLSSPARLGAPLLQSFLGFEIETEALPFEPDTVELMDFSVPQRGEVRFAYVLPFSQARALVEFTVFSRHRPTPAEFETELTTFLKRKLGDKPFSIRKRESGAIPMDPEHHPLFAPAFADSSIESIGAAAGRIKPSTGYSFLRNLASSPVSQRWGYATSRFRFYDQLLLSVVRTGGGAAARVFTELFKRNPPDRVFAFLDEQSRLRDEARIFFSLPWFPFLREWLTGHPFFFAALVTLLLGQSGHAGLIWVLPLLGLATTGISHGSLDHLLDPRASSRGSKGAAFYLRYLGIIALFAATWTVAPALALAFFLAQSADHFGEAQWARSLVYSNVDARVRLLSWIWGLYAATFGVAFHWSESLPLVRQLVGFPLESPLEAITPGIARVAALILALAASVSAAILDRYEHRASGRHGNGLPATLALTVFLASVPLLPGFLCFFAFWHGWDSMRAQQSAKGWNTSEYIRRALPFTLVAWAAIGALFFALSGSGAGGLFWKALFLTLGALTAAHAPVMKRLLLQPKDSQPT